VILKSNLAEDIIKFTKMCGTGNDFIVIDNREKIIEDVHAFSKHVCERRFGIGADGVLLLEHSKKPISKCE